MEKLSRGTGAGMSDIVSRIVMTSMTPSLLVAMYLNDIILFDTLQVSLTTIFFLLFGIPFFFKCSFEFQRRAVFLNSINIPQNPQFHRPSQHGLLGARNLYIRTEDQVTLGVWHILPEGMAKSTLAAESLEDEDYEKALTTGPPVVVYMHGNSSNRAAAHHVELHQVLRKWYHVVTFDYRGYGDSTGAPLTEHSVVSDAITIIRWVHGLTDVDIFVWGHSLGTGVSTHALHLLEHEDLPIRGLVLESPFDNFRNEIKEHPLTLMFKNLPWFTYTIVDAIYNSGFRFESDIHIMHVNCPILMLHAEDDLVVPYKLGFELYKISQKNRTKLQGDIQFEKFSKKFGYGHRFICRAPELPNIIRSFMDHCIEQIK